MQKVEHGIDSQVLQPWIGGTLQPSLHTARTMMLSLDCDGCLVSVDKRWLEALGYEHAEVIGRRFIEFLTPESRTFARTVVLPDFFRTGECADVPYRLVKKNGDIVDVLFSGSAALDAGGSVVCFLAVLHDITARKRAAETGGRPASKAESSGDAVLTITRDRIITGWSPGAEAVYGYTADEMIGRSIAITIPSHRVDEAQAIIQQVLSGEVVNKAETDRLRKDGTLVPVALTASPLVAQNGTIVGIAAIVRDITARKQAETRRKLLLDELNHRVKNTLVAVQSIAREMARERPSPERFYAAFRARLLALSHAHDLLTLSSWQGASLSALLRQVLVPYTASDAWRVVMAGPEVTLGPNAAVALAMAFHELATNAAKYGALSVPNGRIAIAWQAARIGETESVELRWVEIDGPAVRTPARHGFGSRLIERGLAHELGADVQLEFASTGLECRIRLPLSHKVRLA